MSKKLNTARNTSLPKSSKRSFKKRAAKILFYFASGLILLAIFIFFAVQTDSFNKWLLEKTISSFNSSFASKESTINASTLEGNIFTGLRLLKGELTVKQDTLLKFDTLEFKYNVFSLINKKISVNSLYLASPQINLTKVRTTGDTLLWNYEYLLRTEQVKTDTTKHPFDWGIYAPDVRISNATVKVIGSKPAGLSFALVKFGKSQHFDPANMELTELNIDMGLIYSDELKSVNLRNLSFKTNSDFRLRRFAFEGIVTSGDPITEISKVRLITNRTRFTAPQLYMNHFDPFKEINFDKLKTNYLRANIISDSISLEDLKYFLPQLDFMGGNIKLNLNADGRFGKLNIRSLVMQTRNSSIDIAGTLSNLDDPNNLFFDVKSRDMVLDPSDTRYLLPGLQIPDYSYVGPVHADVNFSGKPVNFSTEFNIRTSSGNASGLFQLNSAGKSVLYKSTFQTDGLNIGAILKNKNLESSVNLKADVSGTGFDLNTMDARINYELTSSKIYGLDIVKSGGTLNIFHKNVDADIVYQSDHIQTSVKGKVDLNAPMQAEYTAKGEVHNFDLSEYTKNHVDKSNLNFTFDASGKGLNPDNIEGTYHLNLENSNYASYHFPSTPVDVKVNNRNQNGSMHLSTKFFDFDAKGKFDIHSIAAILHNNLALITNELNKELYPETVTSRVADTSVQSSSSVLDVEYTFTAKNLLPISRIFDTAGVQFIGSIDGSMKNSPSGFSSYTKFNVKELSLPDNFLALDGFSGSVNYYNDYTQSPVSSRSGMNSVISDVEFSGNSMKIGNSNFENVSAGVKMDKGVQNFFLKIGRDSAFIVDVKGSADLGRNLLKLNLDRMYIRNNNFDVRNNGNLLVDYDHSPGVKTFTFRQFSLNNDFMKLSAEGTLSETDSSNLDIETKAINVSRVLELLFPQDTLSKNKNVQFRSPIRGNIRRLSVYVRGTAAKPIVSLEMNSDLLRYHYNKIGRIDAFLDYQNSVLSTDVLVSNAVGNGKLRITGDIPVANPLAHRSKNSYDEIVNNPVDLKVKAQNFQVSFFSRLIPHFTEMSGILDGEIGSKGTVAKPELTGEMNITNGKFFFGLTGMYHKFTTKLRTENSDLVVDDFRIFNMDNDARHLDFWGRINFEGFTVNDINLSSSGDIVVLDQSSDENELGFYGNMLMGIGTPAVTVRGNLKQINVEGQLLIKSANLRFPSVPTTAYDIAYDNFVYRTLADTSGKVFKDTVIVVTPDMLPHVDPFLKSLVVSGAENTSVQTNVKYNLNVQTVSNAYVSIDFNDITKEQLFGEIRANLDVSSSSTGNMQIFGNIYVTGDSYYRFYRNFKVTNSRIIFTGSPYNPLLDIHAVYSTKPVTSEITTSNTTENTSINLDITGSKNKPQLSLSMVVNGMEETGPDAQSDAISYLLFGVSKNSLVKGGQQVEVAKNIGTTTSLNYLSSMFGNALKDIAPFIVNTELNYTEGSVTSGTDIRITSEFGDATVRFGGKILSGFGNAEVTVDYPLDKLLNVNVSNNLILEVFRVIDETSLTGTRSVLTGARLIYRIRY